MKTNNDHYSIDLETLANRFDSAILSIGVVQFDPSTGKLGAEFYKEIDIDSSIRAGHVNGSTLSWWMQQGDKARRIFGESKEKVSLATALDNLATWLRSQPASPKVWGNGVIFDISALENAYVNGGVGLAVPWNHANVRDMRTIVDVAGFTEWPPVVGAHHNTLNDARYKAQVISACWQKIHGAVPLGAKSKPTKTPAPVTTDDEEL